MRQMGWRRGAGSGSLPVMKDPLVELTPGPSIPVAPAILAARRGIGAAVDSLVAVQDAVLEAPWTWRPGDPGDADVRYGFYRVHERIEEAIAAIVRGRAVVGEGLDVGPAVPILAAATAARWELHGALAGLSAADLDADPGGGEWTARQTLGHIVGGQRAYGWFTAWWLHRGPSPEPLPEKAGDPSMPKLPDEVEEAAGSPQEILGRLGDLVDLGAGRFAGLDARALSIPARWSGLPVSVGFRLGRWGSHIREHTIQVDKTLAMVGRPTSEVERLVRLIRASQGRLESLVFGRSAATLARSFADGGSATAVLESVGAEVAELAGGIRKAAETAR